MFGRESKEPTYRLTVTNRDGSKDVQYGLTRTVVKHWLAGWFLDEKASTFKVEREGK
jgi:hypothetical protein